MTPEQKQALISLATEANNEGYNNFYMKGLVKHLGFTNPRNRKTVDMILEYLRSYSPLTQRLYLALLHCMR